MKSNSQFDTSKAAYQQTRITHWDAIAEKRDHWRGAGGWYHRRLNQLYLFLIPPGQHILEIGCSTGDLLAELRPARGVGVDFSPGMIARARAKHPTLEFIEADAHNLAGVKGPFDVIIFSDAVNDLWDVQTAFEQARQLCAPSTRLIANFYSHLWQLPLGLVQRFGLANPLLDQNWLTREDITGMLNLAGFEVIRATQEILWPLPLGGFFNHFLVRFWPFTGLALSNIVIARPSPERV